MKILPELPFLVKNITPDKHEEISRGRVRDYIRWPDEPSFEIDYDAVHDASVLLGLQRPVRFVFKHSSTSIAAMPVPGGFNYKDGWHTVVLRPAIPDEMVDGIIMHELVHCAQADWTDSGDIRDVNAYILWKHGIPYENSGPNYLRHPIELQAVGSEWFGRVLKIAKPLGNFKLKEAPKFHWFTPRPTSDTAPTFRFSYDRDRAPYTYEAKLDSLTKGMYEDFLYGRNRLTNPCSDL